MIDPRVRSAAGVEMVTLGCRLNTCESAAMQRAAVASGLSDAVIVNTCAVTAEAVRQGRQAIRRARRERPTARLIATGCAVQIDPRAFAAMEEVDVILGNAEKLAPRAWEPGPRVRVGKIMEAQGVRAGWGAAAGRARAYVEIQAGCDHRCTFCVIPFGRGRSRSIVAAAVIDRVRAAVRAGHAEVVLTGVDLTSWGDDQDRRPRLGELVRGILYRVPELPRLRLSSIDAAEADDELIESYRCEPRLAPHLHLSLQSGDDLILKRMKRRHSRDQALALIAALRRACPHIAIGADLIAGFPTETEAAFENTLALVEDAGLAFLHVFPFSQRPGTPAARMPPLPAALVKARAHRLREAGGQALRRHLARRLGSTARALVEAPGRARDADYTEIAFAGTAAPGRMIVGAIVDHDGRRARLDSWRPAAEAP